MVDLLEDLLRGQSGDLGGLLPLDEVGQHRGGRLRDGAASPLEADLFDRLAGFAEPDRDRDLVAAERVLALRARIVRLDLPRVVVGGRGARTLVIDAWAESI